MIGNVVKRSDKEILRQVKWWRISLSAMHEGGTKVQVPWRKFFFPLDPVLVFSDAAGV